MAVVVRVVIVGTVRPLIFRILVDVALLKFEIVPELTRFTVPPALLVMPVIAPVPLRLRFPVLVKLARAVLIAPAPLMDVVPALANVVIDEVPPIFRVLIASFVNVPVPDKAVLTVNVPLFV